MQFRAALLSFVFLIGPSGGVPADAQSQEPQKKNEEARRVDDATTILIKVLSAGETIPREVLDNAVAIAVLPYVPQAPGVRGQGPATRKARFMSRVRARGIMSVRGQDGGWLAPAFVTINGGTHSADLVLVVMSRSAVDRVLGNAFKFESNVAPGPLAQNAKAASPAQPSPEVYAYTHTRDGFSGATLDSTMFLHDNDATRRFYGKPLTGVQAAAQKGGPEPVPAWLAALHKHATK